MSPPTGRSSRSLRGDAGQPLVARKPQAGDDLKRCAPEGGANGRDPGLILDAGRSITAANFADAALRISLVRRNSALTQFRRLTFLPRGPSLRAPARYDRAVTRGLSDLTIVIPTRDRPDAVARQLRFWGNSDAQLLILDNGNKRSIDAISAPNVCYQYKAGDFLGQLKALSGLISTPFAIFCDDDNLLVPSGLVQARLCLESDKDALFSWGRAANFQVTLGRVYLDEVYGKSGSANADSCDPMSRLRYLLDEYRPSAWYAVHRSGYFVQWAEAAANLFEKCTSMYACEVGTEIAAFANGRGVHTPRLLLLRSLENPPIGRNSVGRTLGFAEWFASPRFSHEVRDFWAILESISSDPAAWPATQAITQVELARSFSISKSQASQSDTAPSTGVPGVFKRAAQACRASARLAKRRTLWWWTTKRRGLQMCAVARFSSSSGPLVLGPSFSADTEFDIQELKSFPWQHNGRL